MQFENFYDERRFREMWDSVRIARPVHYTLFTFGDTSLPYFLVEEPEKRGGEVTIKKGEVQVQRPTIITPGDLNPEFRNFFDEFEAEDGEEMLQFLMARTAAFSQLKFDNVVARKQFVTDSAEESVSRLDRQLDEQEEDRVAILVAPYRLGGVAVLRYATERVVASTPGNVQDLRDRGML